MNLPLSDGAIETESVLDVPVGVVDLERALRWIEAKVAGGNRSYVSLATAHGVQDARSSAGVARAFREADLVVPDGMSMVWLLRLSRHRGVGRVYGPDLLLRLCERSIEPGWRHFFLGGSGEINCRLRDRLAREMPGLRIAGGLAPDVDHVPVLDEEIVATLNASRAEIVWVGLGTPKQDLWMNTFRGVLRTPMLIGVGAAFDFLAGSKRQAPGWIQRAGAEWLYRWGQEPARLTRRYRSYPLFAAAALAELTRKRLGRGGPNR